MQTELKGQRGSQENKPSTFSRKACDSLKTAWN